MLFHDYKVESYCVLERGRRIVFTLIWDYPGQSPSTSLIEFSEVAAYHFRHTGDAIITDLLEVPIADIIANNWDEMSESYRLLGAYTHWKQTAKEYQLALEAEELKGWFLYSAIGFSGYVIAERVRQV